MENNTYKEVNSYVLKCLKNGDNIPTKSNIVKNTNVEKVNDINKFYLEEFRVGYTSYYSCIKEILPYVDITEECTIYKILCKMWDKFYDENGRYPNSEESNTDSRIPDRHKLTKILGDKSDEFRNYYRNKDVTIKYNNYCNVYIEESNKIGRPLSQSDLDAKNKYSEILPSVDWLVEHSPSNIKTFKQFYNSLGFVRKDELSKDEVVELIMKKVKSLDRNLQSSDFNNSDLFNPEHVGHGAIWKFWGSFNNMMIELGLPINRESMSAKSRSISEMKDDILRLCEYIKSKENRIIITVEDIDCCEWCLSYQTYHKLFRDRNDESLSDYIKNLRYKLNKQSFGMIHEFEDGEITVSKHEFRLSSELRKRGIKYDRNVPYKDICNYYEGRKDCDYLIYINDTCVYVEIAGMLVGRKSIEKCEKMKLSSVQSYYLKNMKEKVRMLKDSNVEYFIIVPDREEDYESLVNTLHNKVDKIN